MDISLLGISVSAQAQCTTLFIFMFIYFISFMLLSRDFCIFTILVWVFCSCMHGHLCHFEMVLHLLFGGTAQGFIVTDSISSMGNFSFSALSSHIDEVYPLKHL